MPALLVFGIFLITLAISIPIGISMVLGSVAPIFLLDVGGNIPQLLHNTFSGANNTPILAVPLFILGGVIMAEGGISKRLFNFFAYFVGRIPGGVPCAVILTCLFYGAISGSGPATTAAVGSMCIPFMVSLGYERRWSAGLIAVAGGLGVIIPPSIPFVLYSMATGVSTGDLFLGGVLPGILIGLFMMIYAVVYCLRKGEDKEKIRDKMTELKGRGLLRLFLDSFWALLCPVIILGGIYSGLFTPTEAACVSVFYAILVSLFIYKTIQLKDLIPFLCSSVKTYGGLAFVLAFATAFGRVLSMTKATQAVEAFIVSNFHSAALLLTVLVLVFLLLAGVMVVIQDLVGAGLAQVFQLDGRLGLCMGSIPLVGGHGTAGSFGPQFEDAGVMGASVVAVACATYGLVSGSLMGGPIARAKIKKYNLHSMVNEGEEYGESVETAQSPSQAKDLGVDSIVKSFALLIIAAGIGTYINAFFTQIGVTLPTYMGAMIVGLVIRNVCDVAHVELPMRAIDVSGNVSLNVFLAVALMTLKLWELASLAVPMIIILAIQTFIMFLYASYVVFPVMGRDYEAAAMTAAFCGFGMGATPNAMANMLVLTNKFGPAPKAFFVVPIVGGMFIDFVNTGVLTVFLQFLS